MKISIIIPAAGLSRRHSNKLLKFIDGQSVIEHTISTFLDLDVEIIVVIGNKLNQFRDILSKYNARIKIVENCNFRNGKSTTVKQGILGCNKTADYFGFCNGDLPFIKKQTAISLLKTLRNKKPSILVPTFDKQIGHPIFFHREFRDKLLNVSGDTGGVTILKSNPDTLLFNVNDSGIILDMDLYLTNE